LSPSETASKNSYQHSRFLKVNQKDKDFPMLEKDDFEFRAFDQDADVAVRNRNLPHWFQPGVAIFITFRTLDSLPREVLLKMRAQFEDWLNRQKLPAEFVNRFFDPSSNFDRALLDSFSPKIRAEILRRYDRLFHQALDDCHGDCILKNDDMATIVSSSILHGNAKRYDLESFVIMPNHVHAIVKFRPGFDLRIVGQSWMRYSARLIHARNGGTGGLWQPEPFDHIVRSPEQFAYMQQYIASNPEKACLRRGEFIYWNCHSGFVD
jgi:REP element-mobilizing transposase RayT